MGLISLVANIAKSQVLAGVLTVLLLSLGTVGNGASALGPLMCNGFVATIVGTPGDDVLIGTSGDDVILGLDGNDTIQGKGGDDIICSGPGDDVVDSGSGDDRIYGDGGHDTFDGGDGNDFIDADQGNSGDHVTGGAGDDFILLGSGHDEVYGGNGNDVINAGDGDNYVEGNAGNDEITTGSGDDEIYGGIGDDVIVAGEGKNYIEGGAGMDRISSGSDKDEIYGNNGVDTIFAGDGKNYIEGGAESDFIISGSGNDTIFGQGGDDCINSGTGNDTIDGGVGNNLINISDCVGNIIFPEDENDEKRKILEKKKEIEKQKKKKFVEDKRNAIKELKKSLKIDIKELRMQFLDAKKDLSSSQTIKELKMKFKENKKDLKDDFKSEKVVINQEFKAALLDVKNEKQLEKVIDKFENEIKETILELKKDPEIYQELQNEIKKEFEDSQLDIKQNENQLESYTKNKIDSKIASLSKTDNPSSKAKEMGISFKHGQTKLAINVEKVSKKVLKEIESLGKVDTKTGNHIQVTLDVNDIAKLRSINGIDKIRPTYKPIQFEVNKLPVSEGVFFLNADIVQYAGITGKGVKVAVLDIAFDSTNEKIADNIVDVKSFRQGFKYPIAVMGTNHEDDHGTAVAEIITDVAPDVELFLYTMGTDVEFAQAVDEALYQNVDLIVMAAGWPNLPTNGHSHITQKVEEAIKQGISFVVPSGNFANKHWQGEFLDANLNGWHEFVSTDEGLTLNVTKTRVLEKQPIIAYAMWDVGLGDVADLQLVLVDPFGQIVDYSANIQYTNNDTPFEYIHHIPQTDGLYALGVVNAKDATALSENPTATLEIFTPNDELEHPVATSSVSVPADANGAIVVGAVNHIDGILESFSSQGPTNNGKLAPHVVGPDGVTTVALDGKPFFGTSATAPYIAGMAALLLESHPNLTPEQLRYVIQENTRTQLYSNFGTYDNTIGYGQADAIFLLQDSVGGISQ